MTASIDFTYQFLPEALLHRAIGAYALKEHVFKFVFSSKIGVRVKEEGERTFIQYHTPRGMVSTCKVYSEEMKRGGVSIPWVEGHIIKKPEDYRAVACLFENLDIIPQYDAFLKWEKEVGEDGLCAAWFAGSASPMHHIQKYFLDATEFFFHYRDYQKEMRALAEAMTPLYEKALKVIAESPARAVNWGGNFDEMITYPPYFEKELLPWIQKASATMGAGGKFVFCHCDGENQGLLDLIRDSGMHVAESVCPYPMTKVKIEEYYRRWNDRLTIFGGVPSNILLPSSATDEEFQAFLDDLFKAIAPGKRFILGVADTTPRDADFSRLKRIGEMVQARGRLPLEGGADRPLTASAIRQAAARVTPQAAGDDLFQTVREDVLQGDEIRDSGSHPGTHQEGGGGEKHPAEGPDCRHGDHRPQVQGRGGLYPRSPSCFPGHERGFEDPGTSPVRGSEEKGGENRPRHGQRRPPRHRQEPGGHDAPGRRLRGGGPGDQCPG